jgi:hypothetical protein
MLNTHTEPHNDPNQRAPVNAGICQSCCKKSRSREFESLFLSLAVMDLPLRVPSQLKSTSDDHELAWDAGMWTLFAVEG